MKKFGTIGHRTMGGSLAADMAMASLMVLAMSARSQRGRVREKSPDQIEREDKRTEI